jgi:hypothetical protein
MGQDVYRLAFDEATAELNEIIGRVEQLRQRKDRIEKFVEAFRPLLGLDVEEPAAEEETAEAAPYAMEQTAEPEPVVTEAAADPSTYSFQQVPVPLPDLDELTSDPFQRRVRSALRFRGFSRERAGLQQAG